MESTSLVIALCLVVMACQPSRSQNPIFQNNPLNEDPSSYKFSLTSNSDCSDELKNIFDYEATIIGYQANSLDKGPTDCTIRITSQDQFPNIQLSIKVIAANIGDCDTQFSIYDGQGTNLLNSFDCRSDDFQNRRIYSTSGDTVSFTFKRPNPNNYNFDIEVKVKRLRGGPDPDDTWDFGQDFFFDKFPQEAIIGMIGGFYAFILAICIGLIIYFNYKYQGRLKRWETHQLSTMRSGTAFDSRSQLTEPSNIWTAEAAERHGPASHYSRSHTEPYSRRGRGSEDGSSVYDDSFQKNQMNYTRKDQNRFNRDKDRFAASETADFSDPDDDPDHFVEKVITPRVRTRPRRRNEHRPPSFEEAISERSSRRSSEEDEDDETESSDGDSAKKSLASSYESSRSSRSISETETESEDDSRRGAKSRRQKGRKEKDRRRRRRQSSTDGEESSHRSGPQKRRGPPAASQAPMPPAPYAAYPPGQFVPVMAGPNAFQPMQMVPNYPPPQYPEESQPPPRQPQIRPTDPPVYSYLVRRGYTPVDPTAGNSSAASSQRGGAAEEPEMPLQSGVEYMRR